jgi:hypothetical protein
VKLAAKRARVTASKNDEFHQKCSTCSQQGTYSALNHHSSSRSKKCPHHVLTVEECLEQLLGGSHERFTIKHGLEGILRLSPEINEGFYQKITNMVDVVREVTFKAQLFLCYFLLEQLKQTVEITPIYFSQSFFYAGYQLVMGASVTSTNSKFPGAAMEACFQRYVMKHPTAITGPLSNKYTTALASFANASATNFVNHIVESFETRLTQFIEFLMRRDYKVSMDFFQDLSLDI